MRFRPFALLAGMVTALCAGMSTQASADALYTDIWLPGTTVGGAPLVGGFVYDATTGAVFGDTTSIPGFCLGGACGLNIFAQNALSLSGADGGFLQVAFNAGPTFKTIGSNPILFVDNAGAPGFFPPGIIPSTGGLQVSPISAVYSERWSANATIGGHPLTGGFLYNATTGAVLGDTSSILDFCSPGACGLNIFAQNALSLSGAAGGFLQVAFNAGPTFKTIGSNPILFVDNAGAPGFFPPGIIPSTGSLNVSLVPSPTPGVGLASVFVLAGALFWSRRLRGEKARS